MPGPVKVKDAIRNLRQKGFREESRDHSYFVYYDEKGRKTRKYVYFSHGGAASREVGAPLLKRMKPALSLPRIQDVRSLLDCSMSEAEFVVASAG